MPPRFNADYSKAPTTATAPRFFCDNCNHEVPFNAEICPNCRKNFAAVKCPNCGFSDKPGKFANGCPHCGHQSKSTQIGRRTNAHEDRISSSKKRNKGPEIFYPLMIILLVGMLGVILYYFLFPSP